MHLIQSLNWRYATKKFNPDKQVESQDISILKEAIRLSASSYGLQPFKVMVIENKELKEKLRPVSFNQSQVSDCSHLFVFAHLKNVRNEFIDNYINLCANERDIDVLKMENYGTFMKSTLSKLSEKDVHHWASKQAYIAMSNLLTACAELRVDACPIEGFDSEAYNELLNLDEKNLSACVLVSVGYRADDDANQHLKKVRLPAEDLFF